MLVEKGRFRPTAPPFGAPIEVTPLEFLRGLWRQKTSVLGLWRCLRDPRFSRFGTVPACDGHEDRRMNRRIRRQTYDDNTYMYTALAIASIASRGKITFEKTCRAVGEYTYHRQFWTK